MGNISVAMIFIPLFTFLIILGAVYLALRSLIRFAIKEYRTKEASCICLGLKWIYPYYFECII